MPIKQCNRWIILALVLVLAWVGAGNALAGADEDWPPLELTLTGHTADDGLTTVYINLLNKRDTELSELTVLGTVPEGATFIDAELISAANPGRFDGSAVKFDIEHLPGKASLGPLVYRFKDVPTSRNASIYAWAKWNRPTPGTAISPKLNLSLFDYLGRNETEESPWAERFAPLLQAAEREGGQVGLLIYDLGTGQLYDYNHHELFTPASNIKLLTGAAALDVLGPDYRFQTLVAHDGTLDENGVLSGNLILKGHGDPTLTTETLTGWADALVDAGLRHISGDIVVDATYFEDEDGETGWAWRADDLSDPPQTGALSANHNQVELIAIPGETEGAPSWVRVEPALGRQVVHNNVATVAADQNRYIELHEDERGIVWVEGQIPAGGNPLTKKATAKDPALYAGVLFGKLLMDRGVTSSEGNTVRHATMPEDAQALIDHRSEPLSQVLALMLKDSDNFISEQVLRTTGAQGLGSGSGRGGQQIITHFLEVNGLSTFPHVLRDGCGLRLDNELSPELVVGLLILMAHHSHGNVFHDALSLAGVDGTLAKRLRNTPAQGQVYAKTGSLLGASALSGYATTPDGRELAFAIMMNGRTEDGWSWVRTMRRIQDDMILALLD